MPTGAFEQPGPTRPSMRRPPRRPPLRSFLGLLVWGVLAWGLTPGGLIARSPSTEPPPRVGCQLDYDATGRALMADLTVQCPAGQYPQDVRWNWTSLTQDPLGVDQPVIGGPLELAKGPGFQPLLPAETLGAMCTRLEAMGGGLGNVEKAVQIDPTDGGLQAVIRGHLLVTGRCQPDGPRIHSAIHTSFTLVCVNGTLKDIHSPSSTNEPPPPDTRFPPIQESGVQIVLFDEEGTGSVSTDGGVDGGILWRHMLPDDRRSYFQLSLTRNQQDSTVTLRDDSGGVDAESLQADLDLWHLDVSFGCRLSPPERRVAPFVETGLGVVFADRRGETGESRDSLPPHPFDGVDETSLTAHMAVGARLRIAERCFLEGGARSRWRDSTSSTSEEAFFRLTFGIK